YQLSATVPGAATTGPISVSNPAGTSRSSGSFFIGYPPSVSGLSPQTAHIGDVVTIAGSHLTGATNVSFNGVNATPIVDSDTQVRATVPTGATTGLVTVTNPLGSGSSSPYVFHCIVTPVVGGFSPLAGQAGASVAIT